MDRTSTRPNRLVSRLVEDDPEMADIVSEFVAALPARVRSLQMAWQNQAWDQLKTIAHQLKGAGGSYGYPDLSTLGAIMEAGFKVEHAPDFDGWMSELDALITAARAGLSR